MKDNFKIAVEFAERIKKLKDKHILQIILFGSVAKGEDKPDSDIDVAIIYDSDNIEKLTSKIHKFQHKKIQASFINVKKLSSEPELLGALTGEGILLFGHPFTVKIEAKELKPRVLIIYDTTNISKKERMKLNRALHGSVSKSVYKNKKYITKTAGLLKQEGISKIANTVVLAEPKKAVEITRTLKMFKAEWKEISVWV